MLVQKGILNYLAINFSDAISLKTNDHFSTDLDVNVVRIQRTLCKPELLIIEQNNYKMMSKRYKKHRNCNNLDHRRICD